MTDERVPRRPTAPARPRGRRGINAVHENPSWSPINVLKWIFLITGSYALLWGVATGLGKHVGWFSTGIHESQLAAILICFPSSALFLIATRKRDLGWEQWLAATAFVLSGLCIAVSVYLIVAFSDSFGDAEVAIGPSGPAARPRCNLAVRVFTLGAAGSAGGSPALGTLVGLRLQETAFARDRTHE